MPIKTQAEDKMTSHQTAFDSMLMDFKTRKKYIYINVTHKVLKKSRCSFRSYMNKSDVTPEKG